MCLIVCVCFWECRPDNWYIYEGAKSLCRMNTKTNDLHVSDKSFSSPHHRDQLCRILAVLQRLAVLMPFKLSISLSGVYYHCFSVSCGRVLTSSSWKNNQSSSSRMPIGFPASGYVLLCSPFTYAFSLHCLH